MPRRPKARASSPARPRSSASWSRGPIEPMAVRSLFASLLYQEALGDAALIEELEASCLQLAEDDRAGRGWAKEHGYQGYTSYDSLDDLPIRDPAFADLKRLLDKHVAKFAQA